MLSSLAVVPHRHGQALFGQIRNIRHEDKLKVEAVLLRKMIHFFHLFIELWIEGVPFNGCFLSTIRRGLWQ